MFTFPVMHFAEQEPTCTFITGQILSGTASSYSYTADIGVADDPNRLVAVCVKGARDSGGSISGTIGGIAFTQVAGQNLSNGAEYIISAVVPTGTTATIVINWSQAQVSTRLCVYVLRFLISTAPYANATTTSAPSNTTTISSISPPVKSIVIGHTGSQNSVSWTWAGLIEDYDSGAQAYYNFSSASKYFPAGATTPTITATASGSWTNAIMSVVCWR